LCISKVLTVFCDSHVPEYVAEEGCDESYHDQAAKLKQQAASVREAHGTVPQQIFYISSADLKIFVSFFTCLFSC
jgi:hypothetical protein